MAKLVPTPKFVRDLKYYKHKHIDISELYIVLDCFEMDLPVPKKYKPHNLTGNLLGYTECHIKKDILLLYVNGNGVVTLLRLASHDKLFK